MGLGGGSMSQVGLPPIEPFLPATFLERGVAVPFTTPLLGGTRARPAAKNGIELVVPNPSGGRGAYILPWSGIASLCRPTLHDTVLNTRLAESRGVTPLTIRRVARALAAEGLAGEDAMEAAGRASDLDQDARRATNIALLMALTRQAESAAAASQPDDLGHLNERAAAWAALNQKAAAWAAGKLDQPVPWVGAALEALADALVAVGVGPGHSAARIPLLMARLRTVAAQTETWSGTATQDDHVAYARMIAAVAAHTITLADPLIREARAVADNMIGLLRVWSLDAEAAVRRIARPEWLLDGWERICLIWEAAGDDAARRAAMVEIAVLLPVMPREASDWSGGARPDDPSQGPRRHVGLNEDWRSGAAVLDLIARNEHFRAAAC